MAAMDCDLLVVAPHPDDAEIHCGGTVARHVAAGARVVLVDCTAGEMASRGTPEERAAETRAASEVLGLTGRECLGLPDGGLRGDDPAQRDVLVDALRRHRAAAVCSIAAATRHPDHLALHRLMAAAAKAAALHGLATESGAAALPGVRVWCYEGELPLAADLLVPLEREHWERKMAAVRCYASQFHREGTDGPETSISQPGFLDWIEARGRTWGHHAGAPYAEAFKAPEAPRVADLRRL